jgi:hypothetical protein
VYLQQNGFAMILLRLEPVPEESAEERKLDEGWRHRHRSGLHATISLAMSGRCGRL